MRALLPLVLFSISVSAQDAASVAMMVREQTVDAAQLMAAFDSADSVTRAAAARIVLVRGVEAAIPKVREAFAREANADAAREEMRALVLLGTDEDVASAAEIIKKSPPSLDADFAEAVARVGAPRATSLYLKHVAPSRRPSFPATLAFWGRTSQPAATAARMLGAGDERAFGEILRACIDANVAVDNGVLVAALGSSDVSMRAEAVWYLADAYAPDPTRFPEPLRERALASMENDSLEVTYGREVLRRILGGKRQEVANILPWLRSVEGRARVGMEKEVRRYLTLGEDAALRDSEHDVALGPIGTVASKDVRPTELKIPIVLPPRLAEAILIKTGCKESWVGVVKATVDRVGRVQAIDTSSVFVPARCENALNTMMRLSLAQPSAFTAPLSTEGLQVVKPPGTALCADEAPADEGGTTGIHRFGGKIRAPKIVRRAEPLFPETARKAMSGATVVVVAEALVGKTGCVRDVRILKQAPLPELNTSALIAISKWRFEPALLDGRPVDVLFNVSISYRNN